MATNKADYLQYKGYLGSIEVSLEDGCLFGRLLYIDSLVSYEGNTVVDLQESFNSAVESYLATCAELGKEPERPFKGSFNIRVGPVLHRQLAVAATKLGTSLNDFVRIALQEKLAQRQRIQFTFTFSEIAELLVLKAGIKEGVWAVYVEFGIGAANAGPDETDLRPAAVVPIMKLGIQKVDKLNNLSVDAAQIASKKT